MLWRTLALVVAGLAVFAIIGGKDALTLSLEPQVARIAIEGTITEDRTQLKMLKKIRDGRQREGPARVREQPRRHHVRRGGALPSAPDVASRQACRRAVRDDRGLGGIYRGLGTDYIVARGNTITGSIGVLAQWPEVSQLLDKVGGHVQRGEKRPLRLRRTSSSRPHPRPRRSCRTPSTTASAGSCRSSKRAGAFHRLRSKGYGRAHLLGPPGARGQARG